MHKQNSSINDRGSPKNIILSTLYPDGSEILVPINTSEITEIIFCADEIEKRFGGNTSFKSFWNTKKWEENPSIVFTYNEGGKLYGQSYCQKTGHDHQITCIIAKDPIDQRLIEKPYQPDPQHREKRGQVTRFCLSIVFQEHETILFPLDAEGIASITFNEESILQKIQSDKKLLKQWNSGDWINNPCVLIEHHDQFKLYGRRSGEAFPVSLPLK